MLNVSNVSLQYGSRVIFKEVNLSFKRGNCYGVIGANGAGKSTFLKILSGELEPNTGEVTKDPGERIAVLKQDHFAYENNTVLETVMMGFPELYELGKKRDELYALPEMTEEQGMQAMEIETRFGEIGGYEADSNAAVLLKGLVQDPVTADFVSAFGSKEKYLELGRGMVILKDGKIVSGASSYTRYKEGIEIEVDTAEPERRKVLASIVCSALILDCLDEGLYPSWDAHDMNSVQLARKFGYEFDHEYTAYEVASDRRTH